MKNGRISQGQADGGRVEEGKGSCEQYGMARSVARLVQACVQISAPSLASWVTVGKSPALSGPWFPPLLQDQYKIL